MSAYALHVLLEASERGEALPADLLAAGKPFRFRLERRDGDNLRDERTPAYAIYLNCGTWQKKRVALSETLVVSANLGAPRKSHRGQ